MKSISIPSVSALSELTTVALIMIATMVATLLISCGDGANEGELHTRPGVALSLAEHRAATISNLSYRLKLDIPAEQDAEVKANVQIRFDRSEASTPLQLDFREDADKIKRVSVNGETSSYRFLDEHLVIPSVELQIGPNTIDIELIAGPSSLNRNPEYLYTLFVPDRARTAFPLFDQPNLKATYELTLIVPPTWTAIANAPLSSREEKGDRTEYRFEPSDLISSYLFSFVAGRFEVVKQSKNGREMTLLHRETDEEKVERNLDAIFELHAASLEWLEDYTGIPYPYQKFDFALIPSFQYGGMEHVGAIQYRASSLLLDEAPSATQLLGRASLIAHETAHMWFGNLVTMDWFNDVWTKEVYANFMAAKIVNPSFPDIDHDLNFLVRHYPAAYAVDRSEGANPIRQDLPNLSEAGQLYGAIIYNKAPIMMRQLERLLGEERFREGIREYLTTYSFGNATWPDLIRILDAQTKTDLASWSQVWVNTPGRPTFEIGLRTDETGVETNELRQRDPAGLDRVWPQQFSLRTPSDPGSTNIQRVRSTTQSTPIASLKEHKGRRLFNSDGLGYGLFPADLAHLDDWHSLTSVEKGSELINLYENLLEGKEPHPDEYFDRLVGIMDSEQNQLLLNLAINQASRIFSSFLSQESRERRTAKLEASLWQAMLRQKDDSRTKLFFDAFSRMASSEPAIEKLYAVWSGELMINRLKLAENDSITLAETLCIRMPGRAEEILEDQLAKIENPDNRRRLEFIAPSLSPDPLVRDAFFASLADETLRETERWVLDALANLHHPLRTAESEKHILPSLELLQEIQVTGDIFFPKRWLDKTLQNHRSATAAAAVRSFLEERPNYNPQLRMKILQAADLLFRANQLAESSI